MPQSIFERFALSETEPNILTVGLAIEHTDRPSAKFEGKKQLACNVKMSYSKANKGTNEDGEPITTWDRLYIDYAVILSLFNKDEEAELKTFYARSLYYASVAAMGDCRVKIVGLEDKTYWSEKKQQFVACAKAKTLIIEGIAAAQIKKMSEILEQQQAMLTRIEAIYAEIMALTGTDPTL